jgi:hypothetical protein
MTALTPVDSFYLVAVQAIENPGLSLWIAALAGFTRLLFIPRLSLGDKLAADK